MSTETSSEAEPRSQLITLPAGVPALTLGWEAVGWMVEYLRQPNGPRAGEPFRPTLSQVRFLLWYYALDDTGRWLFHHAVRRLAKGAGKSPFAAAHSLTEFCGPVRLADFDPKARGGCVGKPVAMPLVQIAATAESQTANTMRMVRAFATKRSKVALAYDMDVGKTIYYKPGGGQLEVITSSASAAEGAESTFVVADETEHWTPSTGGDDLYATIDRNLAKSGSRMVETANAWEPGAGSIAESSYDAYIAQQEGRVKVRSRILYDARIAPPETDMADETSLMSGLQFVYDDCTWVDLTVLRDRIWDPRTKPDVSRKFYLNQPTVSSNNWLAQHELASCVDLVRVIADQDVIVVGFDGSRSRAQGITDATALVGVRVSDGHTWPIAVWEQPEGEAGRDWQVPELEVDAAVRSTFAQYTVVGFFADPAKWESWVAKWEADFGAQLKVKATRDHPMQWWMTGGRGSLVVRATEQLRTAILNTAEAVAEHAKQPAGESAAELQREITYDGSFVLTRHALNAVATSTRIGVQIRKATPDSPRKIDATVAWILAWQARLAAVAAKLGEPPKFVKPVRIR